MNKAPGQTGLAVIVLLLALTTIGCNTSHPGTNADRAACAHFGTALKKVKAHAAPAALRASYATAQTFAGKADDAKLRASITSQTRFAIDGATAQRYTNAYAFGRCTQIGAALPANLSIEYVPDPSTTTTCVATTVTAAGNSFGTRECG
jgi:hypothetical protein